MNVGKMDGVSKTDLIDFISDTASIRKSDIGTIDLQKKCTYIQINDRHSKALVRSSKGFMSMGENYE